MEMENIEIDNSIIEDKVLAEALFTKAALARFDENQKQLDPYFFDNQSASIVNSLKKKKGKILKIGSYGKIAIAASFLTIIALGYLYLKTNKKIETVPVIVKIEEIPTSEIEAYLNSNELLAEADLQLVMKEEEIDFTSEASSAATNQDTNNLIN
jgi:hypothetical protein